MVESIIDIAQTALQFGDDHGTGIAAITALLGIPILLWQITQGSRQEKRRIHARRMAALSTLPMTLSGINEWAKAAAKSQTAIYAWAKGQQPGQIAPAYFSPPSPDNLIEAIERMIEAAPKDRIAKTLIAIVAEIQVLNSRLSDTENFTQRGFRSQHFSIDDNILRSAAIYSLAESLYEDARKLSEGVNRDFDRMAAALSIMDVREGNYDEVHNMLNRAAEKARIRNHPRHQKIWDWTKRKLTRNL